MAAAEIYVGGTKTALEEALNNALREVRAQAEGSISVTLYATTTDGSITFSDEDTAEDTEGQITIEVM